MDAVFINPLPEGEGINEATLEPPLGLAYLAAMLERHGFACSIIDANVLRLPPRQVMERIPSDTKLIGFYLNSFNYSSVLETTRLCREERPESVVLLGGPLASAAPEMVLSRIPCHGLVRGEGEYAIVRIMQNIAAGRDVFDSEVPGAAYRDSENGSLLMNPVVRIKDLDQLPFPAYHLLPPLKRYKMRARKRPVAAIITSRGCVHRCTFCSKDIFKRKVTFRSPANVLAEIDFLVDRYGVRQIDILDDNFAHKRSHVESILDGIIQRDYGLAVNLQLGIRAEILDESLLVKMKRAGVFKLGFGVESADPEVLRLCRKPLNLRKVEESVKLAKKHGFVVYGFFIIGLPGETEESFQQTLEFARRANFDVANFMMAVPFVGTELYRMVEADGRFLIDVTQNIDSGFYGGKVFYEYGDNTAEDILRRYKAAYKEFYSLKKNLKLLGTIRSWAELYWYLDAGYSILKGMFAP